MKGTTKSLGKKDQFDRFYTKTEVAAQLLSKLQLEQYNLIIEPSAGNGSFSSQIPNCLALDIALAHSSIQEKNFFDFFTEENNVLVVGNAGKAYLDKEGAISSNYYLKNTSSFSNEELVAMLNKVSYPSLEDMVGPKSLPKGELIVESNKIIEGGHSMKLNFRRIFITGDIHGSLERIWDLCEDCETTTEDAVIVLGDCGFNYYGEGAVRERALKTAAYQLPITLLCLRGNHEARPQSRPDMKFVVLEDDPIVPSGYYYEEAYPNIWYIADGSTLTLNGRRCLFVGGAYSVDKEYRLARGWHWFSDEELTSEEQCDILDKVDHNHYDFIFTHTCPTSKMPVHAFLPNIDQSKVSRAMEDFLETLMNIVSYKAWYWGHFHLDEGTYEGNVRHRILFKDILLLMEGNANEE